MNQSIKSFLFLSAAINILLVGGICGYLAGQWRPQNRHHEPPPLPQEFSNPHNTAFRNMMNEVRNQSEPFQDRIEQAREAVFSALTAKEFNPDLYMKKTQELHQLHGERVAIQAKAVQKMAQTLSLEERIALAQKLRRSSPDRPPPHPRPEEGGLPNDMPPRGMPPHDGPVGPPHDRPFQDGPPRDRP